MVSGLGPGDGSWETCPAGIDCFAGSSHVFGGSCCLLCGAGGAVAPTGPFVSVVCELVWF